MTFEEKTKLREDCNFLLDNIVNLHISLFPDLRYIQNLWVLGIIDQGCGNTMSTRFESRVIDRFSEEPYDTVVRILPKVIKLINEQFPEKSNIGDRIRRANIFTCLSKLGLAEKTEDFKLVPKE